MRFAALAVIALLAGCATGHNVVHDQLTGLEVGKSTRADVEAKLGKATFDRRTPDGNSMLAYVWVDPRIRPASFYLINEGPSAGVDAKSRSAGFFFNDQGVLFDILGSERMFGTGTDNNSKQTF